MVKLPIYMDNHATTPVDPRVLEAAYQWFLSKGVTVVTLLVLHRNWLGSSAWYKLGYEDWTHERRLELKPPAK